MDEDVLIATFKKILKFIEENKEHMLSELTFEYRMIGNTGVIRPYLNVKFKKKE
jgi:hypothetical protein